MVVEVRNSHANGAEPVELGRVTMSAETPPLLSGGPLMLCCDKQDDVVSADVLHPAVTA